MTRWTTKGTPTERRRRERPYQAPTPRVGRPARCPGDRALPGRQVTTQEAFAIGLAIVIPLWLHERSMRQAAERRLRGES
jgi:hypothetical protein